MTVRSVDDQRQFGDDQAEECDFAAEDGIEQRRRVGDRQGRCAREGPRNRQKALLLLCGIFDGQAAVQQPAGPATAVYYPQI